MMLVDVTYPALGRRVGLHNKASSVQDNVERLTFIFWWSGMDGL